MNFHAVVYVRMKPGYSDPEGETTASALKGLGYKVSHVNSRKAYDVFFEERNFERAQRTIEEMCRRLLTNPTKDDYQFELREVK
jgi:phosphoribosylformylglycinamidine synthase